MIRLILTAVATLTIIVSTCADEGFSNSFILDLGQKDYRVSVTGNGNRVDLDGRYDTSVHATWMLRLWQPGFESPGFYGGLGVAYGFYEADDQRLQVFECRGDFGPGFEPVSWLRLSMLLFGGFGYHDLTVPRPVALLTGVNGVGNLGFSYGANAELTLKLSKHVYLSGQGGFRGLYVSYGVFENGNLDRGIESSTFGLLAGASIDFAF
ncbi:MAG TPA: hypothetical protein VHX44_04130 [Planctomycetota bacterium]|nr:hypothetical protein [Planctomycetota bacterium]